MKYLGGDLTEILKEMKTVDDLVSAAERIEVHMDVIKTIKCCIANCFLITEMKSQYWADTVRKSRTAGFGYSKRLKGQPHNSNPWTYRPYRQCRIS